MARSPGQKQGSWLGRARLTVALALLGAGCNAGRCGGSASAPGPGSPSEVAAALEPGALSAEERRAMPGVIAFISERAPQKDVWLVKPTGEETQLTKNPEDDFLAAPSPDGKSVLVIASRMDDNVRREQLRLVALATGEVTPLNPPRARARHASWSPDGKWLVAESDAQGFSDLVKMEPRRATDEQRLTQVREGCFEPAVSPDGAHVAYVSSQEGDPEIYVMSAADGKVERRLTAFYKEDWGPQWSPDGQWLSFLSDREGRERLYLVHPDGTGLVAASGQANTGDEREPAWSPDGKKVAFVGRERGAKTSRIWVASVAGGEPVALTDGQHVDDMPAWSPDGKYLVFVSDRGHNVDLYLMRADGTGQTRLTTAPGADWLPRWFIPH